MCNNVITLVSCDIKKCRLGLLLQHNFSYLCVCVCVCVRACVRVCVCVLTLLENMCK
jgi:hypothetical protein